MSAVSLLQLAAGELALDLAPGIGGAIARFARGGTDIMRRPAPEALRHGLVRAMACYPLVPFSNRIRDALLHFGGERYPLMRFMAESPHAIHGNGWQSPWEVASAAAASATLRLAHRPTGKAARAWPFAYDAEQRFALDPQGLTVEIAVTNRAPGTAPAGLGLHPFFPNARTARLIFRADSVSERAEPELPRRHVAIPERWRFASGRAVAGAGLDHSFRGWDGRARIDWPGLGLEIEADSALRWLVVFVPDGRDEFAVEPVSHDTDAFNRTEEGERDTGTVLLAPGTTLTGRVRFAVQ